jgi:hypothetical protein
MNFFKKKMRVNKLKSRIEFELDTEHPNLDTILSHINEYERDNINKINKLKREKSLTIRKINGALMQTINVHGPITKNLIGSASKRIYGNLLKDKNNDNFIQKILKWITKLL